MHSSKMPIACFSGHLSCMPHTHTPLSHMPPTVHAPPAMHPIATHSPCHTYPPATHVPLPCTPPATHATPLHASPLCHTHPPPFAMHAPLMDRMLDTHSQKHYFPPTTVADGNVVQVERSHNIYKYY